MQVFSIIGLFDFFKNAISFKNLDFCCFGGGRSKKNLGVGGSLPVVGWGGFWPGVWGVI